MRYTDSSLKSYQNERSDNMINENELRAAFARKNYTQEKVAEMLGICSKTLGSKIKRGVFKSDEIERLILILDIKDPMDIFFAI